MGPQKSLRFLHLRQKKSQSQSQQNRDTWCTQGKIGGSQKGGFQRVVLADVPRYHNRNEGTFRCSPAPKNRNQGTFGCSPVPKTGTRLHSPKPALVFPRLDLESSRRPCPKHSRPAEISCSHPQGARDGGRTLRKDVFLPSKHLLSAFYETLPSKNPSKNLIFAENPLQSPSKSPSKKHLVLKNLLRTLLRSVRLHDPLGVHPNLARSATSFSIGGFFFHFSFREQSAKCWTRSIEEAPVATQWRMRWKSLWKT